MISMHLQLAPRLLCGVCKQLLDESRKQATEVEAAIFGSAPYAVCCCCGQEVTERHDRNYRRRWRRWRVKQRAARPAFEPPVVTPVGNLNDLLHNVCPPKPDGD